MDLPLHKLFGLLLLVVGVVVTVAVVVTNTPFELKLPPIAFGVIPLLGLALWTGIFDQIGAVREEPVLAASEVMRRYMGTNEYKLGAAHLREGLGSMRSDGWKSGWMRFIPCIVRENVGEVVLQFDARENTPDGRRLMQVLPGKVFQIHRTEAKALDTISKRSSIVKGPLEEKLALIREISELDEEDQAAALEMIQPQMRDDKGVSK
jgi:hypothetical protein